MNIINQLEFELNFTHNEKILSHYILENGQEVITMSIQQLAQLTYTSPATIVRFTKKLGCEGFNDFKIRLSSEMTRRLESHQKIDVNYPFHSLDTPEIIAHKIAKMNNEVIQDTLSLMDFKVIQKVADLLDHYQIIDIYGNGNSLLAALSFQHKMTRINKLVNLRIVEGEQVFMARASDKTHLSIVISYSGETKEVLRNARTLKKKGLPIVVITSVGDNHLSHLADYVIYIDSKEKIFNKIAPFASSLSMDYVLNILFSSLFVKNYEKNKQIKISFDKEEDARHPKLSPIND